MNELAQKDIVALKKLLGEKREEARAFRFGVAGASTRNVKAQRETRREIARILTELSVRAKKTL
jgi:ribosomal protein L29